MISTPMLNLQLLPIGGANPEDVLIEADGSLLTGVMDGRILRRAAQGGAVTEVANTGGRPLGLELMPDGRLLVCDSKKGLLAVTLTSGAIETLVPVGGEEGLFFCNNASIAQDGRIFFSDSSQRYAEEASTRDIIENIPTGRLLCRHVDGRVEVLMDDLQFANGVVVAPDQSFVLVAETGRACIRRLWLRGEAAGQRDYFATNLPGLPDNLSLGSDGLIWLALVSPMTPDLQRLLSSPRWFKFIFVRLPEKLRPKSPLCCHVMAFDTDGRCIHNLTGDSTRIHLITGVREQDGVVFMGNINSSAIARFTLPSAE